MRRRDRDGVPDDEEKRQIHGRRLMPEPCVFQIDLIQMPNGVAGRFAGVAENEGPRPSGFVQFQRRKAQYPLACL